MDKQYFVELSIMESGEFFRRSIQVIFPHTSFSHISAREVRCKIISLHPPAVVREVVQNLVEPGTTVIWES